MPQLAGTAFASRLPVAHQPDIVTVHRPRFFNCSLPEAALATISLLLSALMDWVHFGLGSLCLGDISGLQIQINTKNPGFQNDLQWCLRLDLSARHRNSNRRCNEKNVLAFAFVAMILSTKSPSGLKCALYQGVSATQLGIMRSKQFQQCPVVVRQWSRAILVIWKIFDSVAFSRRAALSFKRMLYATYLWFRSSQVLLFLAVCPFNPLLQRRYKFTLYDHWFAHYLSQ